MGLIANPNALGKCKKFVKEEMPRQLNVVMAENMDDLRRKFEFSEFTMFKSVISCLIFIHNKDSVEVFTKDELVKYLL